MSRHMCDVFVKRSQFFYPSCASPSSSNTGASSKLALPPQLPASSPPCSSGSPTPVHAPSPAIPSTQPPAPSTSHPATLHSAIPPTPPQPLRLSTRPVDNGMLSSYLTTSSPSYGISPPPLPQPPTPGPPPSLLPPALRVPMPQPRESASFSGAHDFIINNPQFIDNSLGRPGLKELLNHSMPDAFYNSAARYPPPKCHLGTRNDYIAKIMNWALGSSDHHEPILWMRGPFGVGKSAIAQSCAEAFKPQEKLAATLFFSRSNVNRDDPQRVFTSIAYQIATICPPFRDIVDARIRDDPALALRSSSTQFEELIVCPLRQIDIVRSGVEGRVVIIDGLDECRETGQCEIIDIIATSARLRTTPFRWFITSRPEDPIVRTMSSDTVSPVLFHLELPVSRDIDQEILVYLVDEFAKIRKRHHLPKSWPSEAALALLVDRAAGLWIYVTTIVRFVTDKNSLGPQDQLQIVLEFAKDISARVGQDNPLAEMDFFYTLIIQRVPPKIWKIVRKILLICSAIGWHPKYIVPLLDLSEEQFRHSCASIQSVMELRGSDINSMDFHFYHASFLDFIKEPKRSKELCIYSNFLIEYRRELLDWLHQVCSYSTGPSRIIFPSEPVFLKNWNHNRSYCIKLLCFWYLGSAPWCSFDLETAASLERLPFQMMLQLTGEYVDPIDSCHLKHFKDNLPTQFHDKIIQQDKCPTPGCTNPNDVWILGYGENKVVARCSLGGDLELRNNQDPHPGWCPCGSRIDREDDTGSLELELPLPLED